MSRTARRMRTYETTRGRVFERELATVAGDTREGVWGKGGGYRPKVTYVFTVDGVEHRPTRSPTRIADCANRWPSRRWPRSRTRSTCIYDPETPDEAYLVKHSPRLGYWLLGGGILGALFGLLLVLRLVLVRAAAGRRLGDRLGLADVRLDVDARRAVRDRAHALLGGVDRVDDLLGRQVRVELRPWPRSGSRPGRCAA